MLASGQGTSGPVVVRRQPTRCLCCICAPQAIPRITSKGVVCGSVYKVSSQADVAHPIIHS